VHAPNAPQQCRPCPALPSATMCQPSPTLPGWKSAACTGTYPVTQGRHCDWQCLFQPSVLQGKEDPKQHRSQQYPWAYYRTFRAEMGKARPPRIQVALGHTQWGWRPQGGVMRWQRACGHAEDAEGPVTQGRHCDWQCLFQPSARQGKEDRKQHKSQRYPWAYYRTFRAEMGEARPPRIQVALGHTQREWRP
jgi:hypothetical protein